MGSSSSTQQSASASPDSSRSAAASRMASSRPGSRPNGRNGFQEVQLSNTPDIENSNSNLTGNNNNNRSGQANYGQGSRDPTPRNGSNYSETPSRRDQQRETPPRRDQQREDERQSEAIDRHAVVGRLRREKTMAASTEFDVPKYDDTDEIIWETFYHQSGHSIQVMYQSGKRFYLDGKQAWSPFPRQWYSQGLLVTDNIVLENTNEPQSANGHSNSSNNPARESDDRESYIDHPTKGRLATYIFEEKQNVHCYFDQEQGTWVRLPLAWEIKSETVKTLLEPIEEALPDWDDRYDILVALRANNYDPQQVITTYFAWGDIETWSCPARGDGKSAEKDKKIASLQNEVKMLQERLERQSGALAKEKDLRKQADNHIDKLQEKITTLEVELAAMTAKAESLQRERPKTAASRQPSKPEIDPGCIVALKNCTKSLHKDQMRLEKETKSAFTMLRNMLVEVTQGVRKIKQSDSGLSSELEDMRNLYRREALQRKLLYNELQELRGNIRVFFRCRYDSRTQCCLQFPSDTDVMPPNSKKPFKFDKVFTPKSTQEEVFEDTRPIITSCVDGYNVCILAYGQTGSGKTYTMQGPPDNPGVNVRSLKELLSICNTRDNVKYTLKASMVEIYNETVNDLLNNSVNTLEIRAQGNRIVLPGIVEMVVNSLDDIDEIMNLGQKNRTTAATKMNSQSSRSHLIFMITVQGQDKKTGATSIGTLTMCDLAGSERVSKTEATGQRLVEAANINKSLSSLGQVFTALRTGQLHIPYRNCKLTHILQPCLGGDAKACLFVMTSPDSNNLSETISTLQFGSNAQQVQLGQAKKNVTKGPPPSMGNDY